MTAVTETGQIVSEKKDAIAKEHELRRLMQKMGSVLVAYSGGVDSAYLAFIASEELGSDALCILGISPSVSQIQRDEARRIAASYNFNFEIVETDELTDENYASNPANRCYFCKTELYDKLTYIAAQRGISFVLDGANLDDAHDYRPGRIAAREKNVVSPLKEVGLSKAEIRELSKNNGLPTWDKPASPCLSSRIAYGVPVTIERLSKVERGEQFLRDIGFREFRVRVHDELARIEISPGEFERILNATAMSMIVKKFKEIGFRYVTLDLEGFRSGSMNEILNKH